MTNLARDNHYIPQAYLRGWSDDGYTVWAHRLVVPSEQYPPWERKSIQSVGTFRNLYTSVQGGTESDEFERWFNTEFEDPAAPVLEKVRKDARMTWQDWRHLACYVATLDLRTPTAYAEHAKRWAAELPSVLDEVIEDAKVKVERGEVSPPRPGTHEHRIPGMPPVRVTAEPDAESRQWKMKIEVTAGRELWLFSIRDLLTRRADVFTEHRWSILRPYSGYTWFTSDHPVMRLNWMSDDDYNFGGGWGRKHGDIFVPLSPVHLLHTEIGVRHPSPATMSEAMTRKILRLLAERATRWVFSRRKLSLPVRRRVDRELFVAEEEAMADWHSQQAAAETP